MITSHNRQSFVSTKVYYFIFIVKLMTLWTRYETMKSVIKTKQFFCQIKSTVNSLPPISVRTNFINFTRDSVAVSEILNLIRKFIIHNKIHKNWPSIVGSSSFRGGSKLGGE